MVRKHYQLNAKFEQTLGDGGERRMAWHSPVGLKKPDTIWGLNSKKFSNLLPSL